MKHKTKRNIAFSLGAVFALTATAMAAANLNASAHVQDVTCRESRSLMRDLSENGFESFAGSSEQVVDANGKPTGIERFTFFRKDDMVVVVENKGDRPGSESCIAITTSSTQSTGGPAAERPAERPAQRLRLRPSISG